MNKTKVLFIVHQLNYGGVQKQLLSALDAVDYSENDVTVYVRKNRTELLDKVNKNVSEIIINDDTTHYYRKPYSVYLLFRLKLAGMLGKNTEKIKKELDKYIVNCHMEYERKKYFSDGRKYDVAVSYIQGYNALFTAKCVNADRKIMFYHGSTDETHEIHKEVLPYFDKIVGVNAGVKEKLKEFYPDHADKMTFLENYVDAEFVREQSKEFSVPVPDDKTVICTCGRFTKVKGFDIAVGAAKILKNKGFRFVWYFVGDGVERVNLDKQIEENELREHIIITGMKDNPYPYIDACDIYVQPSREESHSLSIVEAKILKKTIVTTSTVGGNVLVKDGVSGLISDISSESVADKILTLIQNKTMTADIIKELEKIDYKTKYFIYADNLKRLLQD